MADLRNLKVYATDGQLITSGVADIDDVVIATDDQGNATYSFTLDRDPAHAKDGYVRR